MPVRSKRLSAALACAAALVFAGAALAQGPVAASSAPTFTPEAFRAHVTFLADDLLQGRDAGSVGYEIAARYVASRFEALGPATRRTTAAANARRMVPAGAVRHRDAGDTPARVTIGGPRLR
jgi:hypothetical protein